MQLNNKLLDTFAGSIVDQDVDILNERYLFFQLLTKENNEKTKK